jgi:hypothetical protein
MKKIVTCRCQSECKNKRCACLKLGKACISECQCNTCQNPFNAITSPDELSDCARYHIKKVSTFSDKKLEQEYELPCGCETATLKELLEDYVCSKCNEIYYYSFCMTEVIDTNSMWHCRECGTCREDGEWHCKYCNECTYGLTLECENCGKKSPYMP